MGFVHQIPILSVVTFVPLIGAIVIIFATRRDSPSIKYWALAWAVVDFVLSIPLWLAFDPKKGGGANFQFREVMDWIPSLGVKYIMAIDGIALLLILLTTLMGIIAIYSSFGAIKHREK